MSYATGMDVGVDMNYVIGTDLVADVNFVIGVLYTTCPRSGTGKTGSQPVGTHGSYWAVR